MKRKSRAAILPYCGDPFLLHYWLKFYNQVWGGEIDRLYICLNSSIEDDVVDYIMELCNQNSQVILEYRKGQMQQGQAINIMLDLVEEEMLMLIEEDAFIFTPGIVDTYFNKVEHGQYELVGSMRGFCTQEIVDQAQKKWGCQFPNLWPNFLFTYTKHLLDTDRNFNSKNWKTGEKIEPLDYVCKTSQCGDTFCNASLQLQAKFHDKIYYVLQHVTDILAYQDRDLPDEAPWLHVNGLSGGITSLLQDQNGRPLCRRKKDPPKSATRLPVEKLITREVEKKRYENKIYWYLKFYDHREPNKISDFAQAYYFGIQQAIDQLGLSIGNIRKIKNKYSRVQI